MAFQGVTTLREQFVDLSASLRPEGGLVREPRDSLVTERGRDMRIGERDREGVWCTCLRVWYDPYSR